LNIEGDVLYITFMLTPAQLRAARALLGIDQRTLAERAGVSLPTIQRMEASDGYVRGVVDTLTKVVAALEREGIELIGENSVSTWGGRGVRLRDATKPALRPSPVRLVQASPEPKRTDA
jgi:transcriptional regulator with XRE-family HTH domain